jgi:salicylate hydroxylase
MPNGKVAAHFDDGTSETGDVLVAADGANSRVRRQFLPQAELLDSNVFSIAGKAPLSPENRLFNGTNNVVGPNGATMFIADLEMTPESLAMLKSLGGREDEPQYIMWGLSARREKFRFPAALERLDEAGLRDVTLNMLNGWHPRFSDLVRRTDLATIATCHNYSSLPVAPWKSTNITLIGDAIHSMVPFGGIGANTALRDARLLCQKLAAVENAERPLLQAIEEYETAMLKYGFQAVQRSMRTLRQITSNSATGRALGKAVLNTINTIPALKNWMFLRRSSRAA